MSFIYYCVYQNVSSDSVRQPLFVSASLDDKVRQSIQWQQRLLQHQQLQFYSEIVVVLPFACHSHITCSTNETSDFEWIPLKKMFESKKVARRTDRHRYNTLVYYPNTWAKIGNNS